MPQSIRSEVRVDADPSLTFRPAIVWNQWSIVKNQIATGSRTGEILFRTPRNFKDTIEVRLGTDVHLTASQSLNLLVGYETGATPRETFEPGLAESDNIVSV